MLPKGKHLIWLFELKVFINSIVLLLAQGVQESPLQPLGMDDAVAFSWMLSRRKPFHPVRRLLFLLSRVGGVHWETSLVASGFDRHQPHVAKAHLLFAKDASARPGHTFAHYQFHQTGPAAGTERKGPNGFSRDIFDASAASGVHQFSTEGNESQFSTSIKQKERHQQSPSQESASALAVPSWMGRRETKAEEEDHPSAAATSFTGRSKRTGGNHWNIERWRGRWCRRRSRRRTRSRPKAAVSDSLNIPLC